MKVLVTGAAGFIGNFVAEALCARGDEVVGLDNINDYYDVRLKAARLERLAGQPRFRFVKADLADEEEAIEFYLSAARQAYEANDVGSRMLFERIAMDEEGHKAWLELQLELIERIGDRAYSAKMVSIIQDEDPST